MAAIRDKLHAAGLEFWVVFYSENVEQFGIERLRPYLKMFDGVTFWFWDEKDVADYARAAARPKSRFTASRRATPTWLCGLT